MFNSQKISNDPEPLEFALGDSQFRMSRPKYDNSPNPILEAFREAVKHSTSGAPMPEIAGDWCADFDSGSLSGGGLAKYIDHARKVLERLVNAYG